MPNFQKIPFSESSPWLRVTEKTSQTLAVELQKEIGPEHPLSDMLNGLSVLARRDASNDIIAISDQNPDLFYIIHLTWTGKVDPDPINFPSWNAISAQNFSQLFETDE